MCGRYMLHADPGLLERAFGVEFSQTGRDLSRPLLPRYNVAPTQPVPIIRGRAEGRTLNIVRRADGAAEHELVVARLGLIPGWANDPAIGNRLINARAETVAPEAGLPRRLQGPALHRAGERLLRVEAAGGRICPT